MLSTDQKRILFLLEELTSSALPVRDQTPFVTEINELLQVLQDKSEALELLEDKPSEQCTNEATFVKLCKLRVIEAQKRSLENYTATRHSKTRQRLEVIGNEEFENDPTSSFGDGFSSSDDKLAKSLHETKSESITKVLQRIHVMAQGEVLRGELNIGELEIGSKTLRDLQESYSGVDILLNGSRRLVKLLDEAEKWDRRCMLASLGFLAFVLVYIIYRRILSGPVKLLLWSLFKLIGIAKLFPHPKLGNEPSSVTTTTTSTTSMATSMIISEIPTYTTDPTQLMDPTQLTDPTGYRVDDSVRASVDAGATHKHEEL